MKQSIRALGWASKILWIAIASFMIMALYSPLKLVLEGQIEIGLPHPSFSNETITVSIPFFINNTGFFDISDLNVTLSVGDRSGASISESATSVQNIPRGGRINGTHVISIGIDDVVSKNLTYLLFEDSVIVLGESVGLKIAHVIPLQASTSVNMSWGAPFYHPSIGLVDFPEPYNSTHYEIAAWLSFENHSPFDIDGTLRLEVFNERREFLGLWVGEIRALSGEEYNGTVNLFIPLASVFMFSGMGEVHAHFESPIGTMDWRFTYGQ
ncbi:MAG: hypothetical protein JSV57_05365 [Candidatus Bathyarchaeota archaeon]|nr:MAG: hypothetical protein JSV57_05365 [Candidatus Bathyarchaeota archaeon]